MKRGRPPGRPFLFLFFYAALSGAELTLAWLECSRRRGRRTGPLLAQSERGKKICRMRTMAVNPMAIAMTVRGLSLTPLSFSVSKYLMRPAEDWKPESFFFAMGCGYPRSV